MYSDIGFILQILETHVRLLRSSLLYIATGENDQVSLIAANIIRNSPAQIGQLLSLISANFESMSGDSDDGPYYGGY